MTLLDTSTTRATTWAQGWRTRAGLMLRTLLFWMVWFAAARALFYVWHWGLVPLADRHDVALSFLYGARMDLSAASYLTALVWIVLLLTLWTRPTVTRRVLGTLSTACIAFVTLLTLTDVGTFGPWRRRLDASLWTYLQTPREAYASASSVAVTPLLFLLFLTIPLTWWLHRRAVRRAEAALTALRGVRAVGAAVALVGTGLLLAIPIRGGLQWTPLNESTVFFSHAEIANLGAQNAGWSLLSSTIEQRRIPDNNPYAILTTSDARSAVDSLYSGADAAPLSLLKMPRPNVILIIWESFTSKVVARLGGLPSVTPQFDRWSHQGVLFDSVFASGERSAQGLVSIMSGFPSIPNEAIMNRPTKAASLPQLGHAMRRAGYRTSYYYGGELAFANMKAYILSGGFDRVTGIEAFSSEERNSKWGAHDHVVLGRALRELPAEPRPFFATIFTLSSHEPFEVPVAPVFTGDDESTQFLNAHHYSDASIGQFLDSASRRPWWDSTLVVIIADHGSSLPMTPRSAQESPPDRHHIPMLWVGGALRVRDTVVHRIGASVDLAPSLLTQLGVPRDGFRWGRNLLTSAPGGFAYFANNEGFAFIDQAGWLVYDERARRTTEQSPGGGASHRRNGSALLQLTFADYLERR